MPQGDKSAYTDKQKRKAAHIEAGYRKKGMSKKKAQARAWATVNKLDGGGNLSGAGRRRAARTAKKTTSTARSAAAKKGWATRRRNAAS